MRVSLTIACGVCLLTGFSFSPEAVTAWQEVQRDSSHTVYRLTLRHNPVNEPFGAVEIRALLRAGALSSFQVTAPANGPWSQVAPQTAQHGDTLRILALAPSITAWSDSAAAEFLSCVLTFNGSVDNPVDSVWIAEAVDLRGNAIVASSITRTTHQGKAVRPESSAPGYRCSARIHQLTFNLLKELPVKATVLDAQGRTVRELLNARLPSGMHAVAWDGGTGKGGSVSAGVYFIRLQTGTSVFAKKVRIL